MQAKRRTCLKCNTLFDSAGPGNRICKRCAQINNRISITEEQLQMERGMKRRNGEVISEPLLDDGPSTRAIG